MRAFVAAATAAVMLVGLSGCAKLMGGLRRDLDDGEAYGPPTIGGRWAERGLLDDGYDRPSIGHNDRSPASDAWGGGAGRGSWVSRDGYEQNRRDLQRSMAGEEDPEGPAFSAGGDVAPPVKRQYRNGSRATRRDFVDEGGPGSDGSLWASDGQTNYYFTKNKIRGIGDIISVTIEEGLLKDVYRETTRTLSPAEREREIGYAQERIRARVLGIEDVVGGSASGPNRQPAAAGAPAAGAGAAKTGPGKPAYTVVDESDVTIPAAGAGDIDVSKSLDLKSGDIVMAEIVDRYPNGNYKIRGTKRVPYRNGTRTLTVLGIVKGTDITEDDTVASGKLYEYRLDVVR